MFPNARQALVIGSDWAAGAAIRDHLAAAGIATDAPAAPGDPARIDTWTRLLAGRDRAPDIIVSAAGAALVHDPQAETTEDWQDLAAFNHRVARAALEAGLPALPAGGVLLHVLPVGCADGTLVPGDRDTGPDATEMLVRGAAGYCALEGRDVRLRVLRPSVRAVSWAPVAAEMAWISRPEDVAEAAMDLIEGTSQSVMPPAAGAWMCPVTDAGGAAWA